VKIKKCARSSVVADSTNYSQNVIIVYK